MPKNLPGLRALDSGDLIEQIEASKEELFNLRFQLATGQLDNPMRLKQVRHDMARMLTILRERELGHQPFEAEGKTGGGASRKVRTGVVVSERMDKTVLVKIERSMRHPVYKKTVRRSSK